MDEEIEVLYASFGYCLEVGDRVVWISDETGLPEHGTVRKLGTVVENPLIGVDFDNQVGADNNLKYLPLASLLKSEDFYRKPEDEIQEDAVPVTPKSNDSQLNNPVFKVSPTHDAVSGRPFSKRVKFSSLSTAEQDFGASAPMIGVDIEENKTYQSLMNILPQADPEYLRDMSIVIGNDARKMEIFVEKAIETSDYPTYKDYAKKNLRLKLHRQYREDFKVESFLENIPDPLKYFEVKSYVKNEATLKIEKMFLASRYPRVSSKVIARIYAKNKKNLYLTCKEIDRYGGPFITEAVRDKSTFENAYKSVTNQDMLKEIAFIENEHKILEFRQTRLEMKQYAIDRAAQKQELLTCNCCYDEQVLLTEMVTCVDGHLFCRDCVKKSAEVQIGDGKTNVPCLLSCGEEIHLNTLKAVLNPGVFKKLVQRQQHEEVLAANIPDLETCPFCEYAAIPLAEDKVFTCLNPDCMQITCRLCKELDHLPLQCEEVEKDEEVKMRTEIENRMTNALVRECYQCKAKIVKTSGCNKMICKCGAFMCYVCRSAIKGYDHFGQKGGCPLHSKTATLHENAVKKEAEKAKAEALVRYPNLKLKHDPTKLPGSTIAKQLGSHGKI